MFYAFVVIAVYTVQRIDICSFLEEIAENTSGNCYCLLVVDVFSTTFSLEDVLSDCVADCQYLFLLYILLSVAAYHGMETQSGLHV